jgi:peptide/nickel transport system substrate-binding protein
MRLFAAVLVVLSLLAAGCGKKDSDEGSGSGGGSGGSSEGSSDATLVVGALEVPSSIDPATVYERFASDVLFNTTNRLVEFPPGATEPAPGLAKEWEISEDGLTYTFTLQEGVKFHNGKDFVASDVKYSLERAINVNDPDGASFLLQSRDEDTGEVVAGIKTIEATDDTTVVITLVAPNTTFLSRLNYTVASIVPEDDSYKTPDALLTGDVASQLEQFENVETIVGTGAFKLASYKPGEEMTFERNDDYWGEKAKVKTVQVKFFSESSQLLNALKNGEVDLNVNELGPAERTEIEGVDTVETFKGPGARTRYLVIDVTKPPFDDVKVRQAIAATVDRQRIIDEVFEGAGDELFSMIPSSFGDISQDYISDLKAELPEGQKIKFDLWYPLNKYGDTEPDMAENVVRSLNESGLFEVTAKSADWASEYSDNTGVGSPYGIYTLGWYPDYFDADDYIEPFYSGEGFLGHYTDPEMDELIVKEQQETDADARAEIFDDIQKKAAEDMPYVPLYAEAPFAYYAKGLTGVESTMDAVQQTRWFVIGKE